MGRAKTGRKAAPDWAALWANSASKSIQTHNGTLGTLAAERLPRSRNSPIESNLTPPSFPPLFLLYHPPIPIHPSTLHFLLPPIHPLCITWNLLHARPCPNCTYVPPYIITPSSPALVYILYTVYFNADAVYICIHCMPVSVSIVCNPYLCSIHYLLSTL